MSFDDRIRDSLDAAAQSYESGPPQVDALAARVQGRRRAKLAAGGAGAAVALALLLVGLAALPDSSAPRQNLSAADQAADGTATADGTSAGEATDDTTSTSAAPPASTSPTTARAGTVGTVHSPPGSIVYPSQTTATTAQPPTTIPSGDTVHVDQDDSGKTFTLRPGQHLVVSLSDPGWRWTDPESDNSAVLRRTAVSASPSRDRVTASFDAEAVGQARVRATKDAACRDAEPPCMVPSYLWEITVNVV